ncbi:hypothetical protein BGZ75_001040, partial [Mortierella antarctica]
MKWPKLPAAKVLAIGTCIGLVHRAETTSQHQQHTFEIDGQHICTQFNLVCDSNVVDTINCFEHSNNIWSNKHCKVKQTFFIDMAEPCFEFPALRASTDSTDESVKTLDGAEAGVGPAADLEESEDDDDEHDADVVAEKQVLRKRWDERKHVKHRQSRRHPLHIKPKHLWSGLCVSPGVFCGNDLFGCNFNSKSLYECDKVGDIPRHTETCSDTCESGNCDPLSGPAAPQGPIGPAGPAGPAGADGAAGPAGIDGTAGPAGADGVDGALGPQGPRGAAGANGVDGALGPQGPTGAAGANGVDGALGPQGPPGAAGTNGALGPQGPPGAAGTNG